MADEELRRIFMINLNHYLALNGYKQADLARYMGVSPVLERAFTPFVGCRGTFVAHMA